MNTKLLMLGILLIAGLSFAASSWMEYSVNRYGCNYNYLGYGYGEGDPTGLLDIAENYGDQCEGKGGCWDTEAMGIAWGNIDSILWGDGSNMCGSSGCRDGASVTTFRSLLFQYNAEAALFKAEFMAGLRAYLSAGGSRTAMLGYLNDAMDDNRACLETAAEEGACWICNPI